ncbi:MAG: diacylglycerol kinase family protein [Ruminococcaceae bacterium]|nr:diacylglycerol kinase family protein [Oscillospiraceae bacterium]
MKKYVLYNRSAGQNTGNVGIKNLNSFYPSYELIFIDVTTISDFNEFFSSVEPNADVIICGGDGTLNHFVNDIDGIEIKNNIYFYATGSGNDFLHDLGKDKGSEPFLINHYIDKFPCVYIDGTKRKFINGTGYGLDGFVCEMGNKKREKTKKKINYTLLALKALFYAYKPRNATVIIDGVEKHFEKAWLTPTMKGKFFGGGMKIAPIRDRNDDDLSVIVVHSCPRLRLLTIFPTIYGGTHIKYKKYVEIFSAKEVTITYDKPCAMQIDGETVVNVKSYTAITSEKVQKKVKI